MSALGILGAVLISLGGSSGSESFLVAPLDNNYEADLSLKTDTGTASVTLQASPNPAGVAFSQTSASLTTAPTIIKVHSTAQSSSRGDTTIQVLDGATVVASIAVTSIKHPVVLFKGRFEARFATQPAFYNQNPMYTATNESVGPGWTWGLEGEPTFVPVTGNVPENLETTGMGRNIRLNNPAALRSHAAPVVSTVSGISGSTTSGTETFTTGDPIIGQPADFGPDTYFAGNRSINSADPTPEEFYTDAFEPLGLFEIHFGNLFGGASAVGPFTHKATLQDEKTRTPDSRPIATGLAGNSAERAEFGLPDLQTFSETRINLLVADYNNPAINPPGPSTVRRNLARRIGHLLPVVSSTLRTNILNANPGAFTQLGGTAGVGWNDKEVFNGKVDANLQFQPAGSSVVAYLQEFTSFNFNWDPFAFHSDELCAHHKGSLAADVNFHGSYTGDPHTRTVNGVTYDFQSVGEFTLLRGGAGMEIQVRQSPVPVANPVTDSHSGLTSCVSIITAVSARVGRHRIALQPGRNGLQFYLDGKPTELSTDGIDLDTNHVSAFDSDGETGVRVNYQDQTVFTATPALWTAHNVWYINVDVSKTDADEGIMGYLPKSSWLPRLRDGGNLGSRPANLPDRYAQLYKKFADSWRVNDKTSLFVYDRGTSTKTFTDLAWPAAAPPCNVKPGVGIAGLDVLKGMPVAEAGRACKAIRIPDLHKSCVFDVATTGDETLVRGYRLAQEVQLYGTAISIVANEPPTQIDRSFVAVDDTPTRQAMVVTATVVPLTSGRPIPTGTVTVLVDGVPMNRPATVDERGYARIRVERVKPGPHKIRATYSGGGKYDYHSSTSPTVLFTMAKEKPQS